LQINFIQRRPTVLKDSKQRNRENRQKQQHGKTTPKTKQEEKLGLLVRRCVV